MDACPRLLPITSGFMYAFSHPQAGCLFAGNLKRANTMNKKTVAFTVAAIGAVATLVAAVLPDLFKSHEQPSAAIQQTSTGTGAINVGHDATFNNTITKSAGEEAAERVQACEKQHGMKTALEKSESQEPNPNFKPNSIAKEERDQMINHTLFRICTWPSPAYADADGYYEIEVRLERGPTDDDASGTNFADIFTAPCQTLSVTYHFGQQGLYQNQPPLTISADTIVTVDDGKRWKGNAWDQPFSPDAGEFVVLHNYHYDIESAHCL